MNADDQKEMIINAVKIRNSVRTNDQIVKSDIMRLSMKLQSISSNKYDNNDNENDVDNHNGRSSGSGSGSRGGGSEKVNNKALDPRQALLEMIAQKNNKENAAAAVVVVGDASSSSYGSSSGIGMKKGVLEIKQKEKDGDGGGKDPRQAMMEMIVKRSQIQSKEEMSDKGASTSIGGGGAVVKEEAKDPRKAMMEMIAKRSQAQSKEINVKDEIKEPSGGARGDVNEAMLKDCPVFGKFMKMTKVDATVIHIIFILTHIRIHAYIDT